MGGVAGGEHEAEAGDVHHTLGPGHRQAPARNCHRGQQILRITVLPGSGMRKKIRIRIRDPDPG